MRYIRKGESPESLLRYAKNKNAYYDGYREKDDVREQLLQEQGYLCGYCMRRIHSTKETKIEHMVTQSSLKENPRAALDYKIMLGVCYGNVSNTGENKRSHNQLTCDAHRGKLDLEVANPFDEVCIGKIRYEADGRITSDDKALEKDLNVTLNLNYDGDSVYLKQNRRAVLNACKEKMKRMKARGQWNKTLLRKILKEYEEPDEYGRLREYSGIAIWYLNKRIGG